jgi:hypothetical protein
MLLMLSITGVLLIVGSGCTSHSWSQIERNYIASYSEVFDRIPEEAKKCEMKLKTSDIEAGVITLDSHRTLDKLTSSLINIFAGDEVIVKVTRVEPTVTKVWIDSKAKGQIGPDFGRTDRNVNALAKVLDAVWAVKEDDEDRGEKRTTK